MNRGARHNHAPSGATDLTTPRPISTMQTMSTPSHYFSTIGMVLESVTRRMGLESPFLEYRLQSQWVDIVGRSLAAHTRPDTIRYKKLYLFVEHSVWLQHLTFLKASLLDKVNAMAGHQAVIDIVMRVGDIPPLPPLPVSDPVGTDREELSPDLLAEVQQHAAAVTDPVLRKSLARVMARALAAQSPTPETPHQKSEP